jgi:23S rRNA (guanosine2251-2'-O)-methyltransferase
VLLICGANPVLEALRAGRVQRLIVAGHAGGRVPGAVALARQRRVPVRSVSSSELDLMVGGRRHQGLAAELSAAQPVGVAQLVASAVGPPLIVVLDSVEDPHNVGAILRSVDAAGAHGVVRQTRRAAPLGAAAAAASAGAVAHVKVADVVNIARALDELKAAGVWTVGLAADARKRYDEIDYRLPTALVVGAEGAGLRRLVRERCDWVVSIPLHGHVQSLNVSVATAIALFEAVRQRRARTATGME